MSDFAKQVEKKILGKIASIENGSLEVKNSGVNDLVKRLREMDEAAAEKMQKKYIEAVKNANKK